ncbi:MAG: peptide/nickel transport system permease protein [Clostridiales bacterium]|jgi:ABC-type dipeptide/oligopeptide/nickel transport system permease subunit|nr:peptide/nickel transport system permease protein [Clostridiales bacterium]MDN5283189.1 peptide/nickel transport system permease protein [Candidatus Ozemobacter sp.]
MNSALKRMTWAGWISLAGLFAIVLVAIFAPWLAPNNPLETDPLRRLAKPEGFLLGCDQLGQCVFSRLIYGTRLSLGIGFAARFSALIIGLMVGMLAGYFGGWLDWALMRVVDMFLAFPSLLLAIAVSMVLGNGIGTVIMALAIVGWAEMARIIRSATLELRSAEFIVAARTLGSGHLRIILTHILPNCMPLITVIFTMGLATAVLAEASLSFLGLGVDPSLPTWGGMVASGKDYMMREPMLVVYPGLCIAFLVIVLNILGDELRDIFDPSRKGQF